MKKDARIFLKSIKDGVERADSPPDSMKERGKAENIPISTSHCRFPKSAFLEHV